MNGDMETTLDHKGARQRLIIRSGHSETKTIIIALVTRGGAAFLDQLHL